MEKAAKQQILVPFDFSEVSVNALEYAVEIARIFKSELSILCVVNKNLGRKNNLLISEEKAKENLIPIAKKIIENENILTNIYVLSGNLIPIILSIIEKINAIMLVVGLDSKAGNKNKYFTANILSTKLKSLRIPILVIQKKQITHLPFKNIILPVDFRKQAKEKAPWASYFSKLQKSKIHVVFKEYKDEYFLRQLHNNMILIKKSFDTMNVDYSIHKVKNINCTIDQYALAYAKVNLSDMVIILNTDDFAIDDQIFGPPEQKLMSNIDGIPVLCINPRDDLFIPCV